MAGRLPKEFGRGVRRHRQSLKLSQEKYGELVLDRDRTYVGAIERGERNLTFKTIEFVAGQIGRDAVELILDGRE